MEQGVLFACTRGHVPRASECVGTLAQAWPSLAVSAHLHHEAHLLRVSLPYPRVETAGDPCPGLPTGCWP